MSLASPFGIVLFPPFGFAPTPPPPIVVIDNEVANWLATTLGVEVLPLAIPQGTNDFPLVVYTIVDGDSSYCLAGPDGLAWVSYQFDSYSRSYADAAALAERLRVALMAFARTIPPGAPAMMGAAPIRNITVHRPASGYDPTGTGEDNQGMYRRMYEATVWYVQTIPA